MFYGKFKVMSKESAFFGLVGDCIDIIEGNPCLFVIQFENKTKRGFTFNEVKPV